MTASSVLSTGNETLDTILGGGIPRNAVIVVAGEPGTGKTILTLQLFSDCARRGERCHYFTTLSEPTLKLLQHLQQFAFYDAALIERQIRFSDVGSILRTEGAAAAIRHVIEQVETHQPTLVAIDSFRALHDLTPDLATMRTTIYDLAATLASWSATTFLVGEFVREDIPNQPEFGIADDILLLTQEREETVPVRRFEVVKMRGQAYVSGRHPYDITADGVHFYPRLEVRPRRAEAPSSERAPSGVPKLDKLLHGGLSRGSSTLISGGTGVGKTVLCLQFVNAGLQAAEPAVVLSTDESVPELRRLAAGFEWDLGAAETAGKLEMLYFSPLDLVPERFLVRAVEAVKRVRAQRVAINSLSGLSLGIPDEHRFRQLVYALAKRFQEEGVTLVMNQEVSELLGVTAIAGGGVSPMAENVLLLRYAEVAASLRRALAVLKVQGSAHDHRLWEFTIGPRGIKLGSSFKAYRGVLTGLPTPTEAPSGQKEP
jgi:circadian clock protein KaiC